MGMGSGDRLRSRCLVSLLYSDLIFVHRSMLGDLKREYFVWWFVVRAIL